MVVIKLNLEDIDIEKYLEDIELVVVVGESDYSARLLNINYKSKQE